MQEAEFKLLIKVRFCEIPGRVGFEPFEKSLLNTTSKALLSEEVSKGRSYKLRRAAGVSLREEIRRLH